MRKTNLRGLVATLVLGIFAIGVNDTFAQDTARVLSVVPGVFSTNGGASTALAVKMDVPVSSVIKSDATGKAQLMFADDSTVCVSPGTEISLAEYVDTPSQEKVTLNLVVGTARVITGEISRRNSSAFKVVTPQATVGIRGTIVTIQVAGDSTKVYLSETSGLGVSITNHNTGKTVQLRSPGNLVTVTPQGMEERRSKVEDARGMNAAGRARPATTVAATPLAQSTQMAAARTTRSQDSAGQTLVAENSRSAVLPKTVTNPVAPAPAAPVAKPVTPPANPGTKPVTPVTPPADPGIKPVTPVTPPNNPGTRPTTPVTPVDPGTKPTTPVTPPNNPGTKPTTPVTPPNNPGTRPTTPVTPVDPGTKPTTPVTPPNNPGTKPTTPVTPVDPGTKPTTPVTPVDPGTKPTTPVTPVDPGTKPTTPVTPVDPGTKPTTPVTPVDPGTKPTTPVTPVDPGTKPTTPVTPPNNPVTKPSVPVTPITRPDVVPVIPIVPATPTIPQIPEYPGNVVNPGLDIANLGGTFSGQAPIADPTSHNVLWNASMVMGLTKGAIDNVNLGINGIGANSGTSYQFDGGRNALNMDGSFNIPTDGFKKYVNNVEAALSQTPVKNVQGNFLNSNHAQAQMSVTKELLPGLSKDTHNVNINLSKP